MRRGTLRNLAVAGGLVAAYLVGTYCGVIISDAGNCVAPPSPSGGDDTIALNDWISGIPDGGCGFVQPREDGHRRVYKIEGTVLISDRHDFTLGLAAATFRAPSVVGNLGTPGGKVVWRPHVRVLNSTNVTITGLRVEGAWNGTGNTAYEGEAAFNILNSSGALVNVQAHGVGGDGVEIGGSTGFFVTGSSFDTLGRMGVSIIEGSTNVVVDHNTFDGIPRSVFDVEMISDRFTSTDIHFTNNTIGNFGLLTLAAGGQGTKSGIELAGNVMTAKPLRVKYVGSDLTVRDNIGFGVSSGPIVAVFVGTGLTLTGNVQAFHPPEGKNPGTYAVNLSDWCEATASGNDFADALGVFQGTAPVDCTWRE